MAVSLDNMATHSTLPMSRSYKQNVLRLMAAILDDDADYARILSRDCAHLGVDPREHLSISICGKCQKMLRWDGSSSEIMEILKAGGCHAVCGYQVVTSFQSVRLYDLAAARGHIDSLSSLPSMYSDLKPPPKSSDADLDYNQRHTGPRPTRTAPHGHLASRGATGSRTSSTSSGGEEPRSPAASVPPASPVAITNGRFTIVSCSEDDLSDHTPPPSSPACGSGDRHTSQFEDDDDSSTAEVFEGCVHTESLKDNSDRRNGDMPVENHVLGSCQKDDTSGVLHGGKARTSQLVIRPSCVEPFGALSMNGSSQKGAKSSTDQAQNPPSAVESPACAASNGADLINGTSLDIPNNDVAPVNACSNSASAENVGGTNNSATRVVSQGGDSLPRERERLSTLFLSKGDYQNGEDKTMTEASQSAVLPQREESEEANGAEYQPTAPLQQEEQDDSEEEFVDSLEGLFVSEEPNRSCVQASSDVAENFPQNVPENISETCTLGSECRHLEEDRCSERREIVRSAVTLYVLHGFSLDKLVRVLRSQPCTEDVISVFHSVAALSASKADSMNWVPLVREFGVTKGPHTGRTPLMAACLLGNEKLLQSLLAEGKVGDINAKDSSNVDAYCHLFDCSARGDAGDSEVRRAMAASLKQYAAQHGLDLVYPALCHSASVRGPIHRVRSQGSLSVLPQDVDCTVRKRQSRLCQLAWQPFNSNREELEELSSLFDQEINVDCCTMSCKANLFPDLAIPCDDEAVPFFTDFEDNIDLFAYIDAGACTCRHTYKVRFRFLPACAAAAAGNFRLFRLMMDKFAERVGNFQKGSRRRRDDGPKSALKRKSEGNVKERRRNSSRMLFFDTSIVRFHGERLLAQALRQMLCAGHACEALEVLDDMKRRHGVELSHDSRMSLVDMALRVGEEYTFRQLLDRFSVSIRSETDGLTPLLLAVSWGNVPLAKWLLQQEGTCPGAVTSQGNDALDIAFGLESTSLSDEMVLMLLKEGKGLGYDELNPRVPSAMQTALVKKRLAVVDYLLDQGQITVPIVRPGGSASSHNQIVWAPVVAWLCSYSLSFAVLRHLLDKGLDCLSPLPNLNPETPLQLCMSFLNPDARKAASALIERGADVNERTKSGTTPLCKAMRYRNCKILGRLILAGAIVDSLDPGAEERKKEQKEGGCGRGCGGAGGDGAAAVAEVNNNSSSSNSNMTQASSSTSNGACNADENTATTTTAAAPRYRRGPPARNANYNTNNNTNLKSCQNSFLWNALKAKEYRIAEMALAAGYRLTREEWFQEQARAGLENAFPAHVPASVCAPLTQPLRLTVLCRRGVRENLGSGLPGFLATSGLPQSVVDYILMKDLVEAYLDEPATPSPQ